MPDIEKKVGIGYFLSKTSGTGGKIKQRFEDFYVKEKSDFETGSGDHLLFTLKKLNWDTLAVIHTMAKKLNISRKQFGFAGNKDKRALTEQKISVFGVQPDQLSSLDIKDVEILNIEKTRKKIRLGNLYGNTFSINIRNIDLNLDESLEKINKIHTELNGKVLNYFTLQRFGLTNPNNHLIGKELINGNLDQAILIFLTSENEFDSEELKNAKLQLKKDKNFKKAADIFPHKMRYEHMVLSRLSKGKNAKNALFSLPKPLIKLFIHSYQSFLFNKLLSLRIEKGFSIDTPTIGDTITVGWKSYVTTEETLDDYTQLCLDNKASLSLPLIGSDTKIESYGFGNEILSLLQQESTLPEDFSKAVIKSRGTFRPILIHYEDFSATSFEDEMFPDKSAVNVQFFLKKGSYATAVIREFTKNYFYK